MEPTSAEIRNTLARFERPVLWKGVFLFVTVAAALGVAGLTMVAAPVWSKPLWAVVTGILIGTLFVVGHDAAHGALTPNIRINRLIGRLALLPSLHPYSAWVHSHNSLHHGWTNLRGHDPVYPPLSKDEFDLLSPMGQWVVRFERSLFGFWLLYLRTIWWRWEVFPVRGVIPARLRRSFLRDRVFVAVFGASLLAVVWVASDRGHGPANLASLGAAFLVWNHMMGAVTYQHHVHPRVRWYSSKREWTFFRGQVAAVVHVVPPGWLDALLLRIMHHTAHHAHTKIPLYRLPPAQAQLEANYPGDVVVQSFSLGWLWTLTQTCQLYDYERHQWLRFDGSPVPWDEWS